MARSNPQHVRSVCHFCAAIPGFQPKRLSFLRPAIAASSPITRQNRLAVSSTHSQWLSTVQGAPSKDVSRTDTSAAPAMREPTDPTQLANLAADSCRKFLSVDGIPAKQITTAALETCLRAALAVHPHLSKAQAKAAKASVSRLASLGQDRMGVNALLDKSLQEAINKISYSAYTIISHPNVEMDARFLETYVAIQSQLGRAESLPKVFALYATKRKPVVKNGEIVYEPQNPNAVSRAIEVPTANMAVQTAIDSRNLDAALGIIEASFCVPAFKRQKIFKHATVPAFGLVSLPFGILGLAASYAAYWQNTMDMATATGIAVVGISGYFAVVGSMGLIAKLSYKDQMKRVTWTPGTPLRYRWLREEERAALDKVACAWGFKEPWRHGEETGPEWEGMKEYMGYRQMLLDRVEFMEGMN